MSEFTVQCVSEKSPDLRKAFFLKMNQQCFSVLIDIHLLVIIVEYIPPTYKIVKTMPDDH